MSPSVPYTAFSPTVITISVAFPSHVIVLWSSAIVTVPVDGVRSVRRFLPCADTVKTIFVKLPVLQVAVIVFFAYIRQSPDLLYAGAVLPSAFENVNVTGSTINSVTLVVALPKVVAAFPVTSSACMPAKANMYNVIESKNLFINVLVYNY